MTAPGRAPLIAADRFPVTVTEVDAADGATPRAWRTARVLLTCPDPDASPRLLVYTRPGDPVLDVAWHPDRSTLGRPRVDWRVVTDGGVFVVRGERGCGCGSRLKLWEPFSPMKMGAMPR